jgi:hypothetical protein
MVALTIENQKWSICTFGDIYLFSLSVQIFKVQNKTGHIANQNVYIFHNKNVDIEFSAYVEFME